MNNKLKVLLSGANGRTGREVLSALARAGAEVRAFVRNDAQSDNLKKVGAIECVVGDMGDIQSVLAAVRGCDKVVHIGPPMHAREVEFTQNFIAAAKEAGVRHFVYYSVMHPLRREVRHHRLKLDAEEALIESELPYTIVQPGRYMQHLELIWNRVKDQGVHAMPFSVERPFSVVDLQDLAAAVAIIVTRDIDYFATYELAGPQPLNQNEMADIISGVIGREVRAEAIPLETMQAAARSKNLPEDRIEQMTIMNNHYSEHGFIGNPNVLTWIINRPPVTFAAYVERISTH